MPAKPPPSAARTIKEARVFIGRAAKAAARKDRDAARKIHEQNKGGAIPIVEVYVSTPIECCERRDPKGLYKQARDAVAAGKGMGFTGVDDPYEPPVSPELTFDASKHSVEEGVALVLNYLVKRGLIAE